MLTRCSAQTKSGAPCSAQAWRDGWCRWHHPELATERQQWRAKGGARRSNRARARKELAADAMTLRDAGAVLSRMLRRLEDGDAEPAVCTAAANLARALATLNQATAIEDRLGEIETRLGLGESA